MGELINGNVTVSSIREISFRDLLGREPVRLDQRKIGGYLKDQTVMVTGAGGSIGTELCRQICRYKPATIILFERAETALFNIDLELKRHFKGIDIIPVLGDVQERHELEEVLGHYLPHTLFHAAAYKHVPMLEMFPWKAVTNNITGTVNVVEAAAKFRVGRFVFVSTDKAVKPSSIMGASKRIAEIYVQNQNVCSTSETRFMTVRFGNVAGSAGSVVPLFKQQIKEGGPVTVTHRDATRFFMTIPEACQLILQSAAMGDGGEIFLLEMGRPVKIDDLARDMIRMSGFEPDNEIIIKYTGLRPGEKISEELMIEGEGVISTEHDKIMVLSGKECNLNLLNGSIEKLEKAAEQMDGDRIGVLLFDDKFDGKNNQCDYQPKPEKCSLV
jgi:FlaA1/EpsC-like NDP-sugar epimerase